MLYLECSDLFHFFFFFFMISCYFYPRDNMTRRLHFSLYPCLMCAFSTAVRIRTGRPPQPLYPTTVSAPMASQRYLYIYFESGVRDRCIAIGFIASHLSFYLKKKNKFFFFCLSSFGERTRVLPPLHRVERRARKT